VSSAIILLWPIFLSFADIPIRSITRPVLCHKPIDIVPASCDISCAS